MLTLLCISFRYMCSILETTDPELVCFQEGMLRLYFKLTMKHAEEL